LGKNIESSKGLIMVIDDEVDTREILGLMLESINYDHLLVKNGKEAIDKYKELKEEIDLIMLDIFMPKMSGSEIYKKLFEIDPGIIALVISGYGKETNEVKDLLSILKDKNADYITKPFDLETLGQKIEKLLKGKKKVAA
jgi:DNA-binding NtrC family response regulator